jgi:hypothetical protein
MDFPDSIMETIERAGMHFIPVNCDVLAAYGNRTLVRWQGTISNTDWSIPYIS